MKEAVFACNAFAAKHFSYAMYLKNTGTALSDYAHGEASHHHHHLHSAPTLFAASPPPPHPLPPLTVPSSSTSAAITPPPPPPIIDNHQLLQCVVSMPLIKILQKIEQVKPIGATIIKEEEGSESESDDPRTQ